MPELVEYFNIFIAKAAAAAAMITTVATVQILPSSVAVGFSFSVSFIFFFQPNI